MPDSVRCLLVVFLAASARAADAPAKPFKASFIGESGSFPSPDAATNDYLQTAPAPTRRPEPAPVEKKIPVRRAAAEIDAPRRADVARPAATVRPAPVSAAAKVAGRPSLWNGLVTPLEMTPTRAAVAQADAASDGAGRDYETHILGGRTADAAPLSALTAPKRSGGFSAEPASGNRIFVTIAIDPVEAGTLHDAVSALGVTTGFSPESQFDMELDQHGLASVSGWMTASRLGDAALRPGVRSVRVNTTARPQASSRTDAEFLVGLRVARAGEASQSADAGIRELTRRAGFRLGRVIGLETAPDGRAVALVSGTIPLTRLSTALALEQVAAVAPLDAETKRAPSAPAFPELDGFARFALKRGPWLIVLTLLLAIRGLRDPAWRAAHVFNPYR